MMRLPVFYYPTTIAWVDDDNLFLSAVTHSLQDKYVVKTFNHPASCSAFFADYKTSTSESPFLRGCKDHEHYDTAARSPVDLNVPALASLYDNADKYHEISVMVVDYNMPGMNGIELCRALRSLPIKKIILTGDADHDAAVAAFNDNSIDRFIRKDSPTLYDELNMHIESLTQQYFNERTMALHSHLETNHSLPHSDPKFVAFFRDWCTKHAITEYYLIDKRGSMMAITKSDERLYFVIHTDNSLDAFHALNDDVGADALMLAMNKRELVPFFGVGREYWEFDVIEWGAYFYKPEVFEGREMYYWVVLNADS